MDIWHLKCMYTNCWISEVDLSSVKLINHFNFLLAANFQKCSCEGATLNLDNFTQYSTPHEIYYCQATDWLNLSDLWHDDQKQKISKSAKWEIIIS